MFDTKIIYIDESPNKTTLFINYSDVGMKVR